jgi:superfamily II DNA/RNA helicase
LQHWYFLTDPRDKIDLIRKLVRHMKPSSALLFVNETDKIGELLAKLRYEGFSVDALYGDTRGQERAEVMQKFRKGRTTVLIATDVAARGLDLPGMPLVIQFEPALDADHYVHRSGRTARMGLEGTSITLVTHQQRFIIDKLEKQLKIEVLPKMLFEGRVCSLEEGNLQNNPISERKPQPNSGEAKDQRPVWKSKAEYMATLKPETRKPPAANSSAFSDKEKRPAVATPSANPVKKVKPAKVKMDRERDKKNKGAPKWLKEKRETPPSDNKIT